MSETNPPQTIQLEDQVPWIELLLSLIGRVRLFGDIVEQSLRTEYLSTEETIQDWIKTLGWFKNSIFPIHQLIQNNATNFDSPLAAINLYQFRINKMLDNSLRDLREEKESAQYRLFRLLDCFRRLSTVLSSWQSDLKEVVSDPHRQHPAIARAMQNDNAQGRAIMGWIDMYLSEAEYNRCLYRRDDTCMALRRAFFLTYFLAVVHPNAWTEKLHADVLASHEKALPIFSRGLAYDSMAARIEKLKSYDSYGFERQVMAGVA